MKTYWWQDKIDDYQQWHSLLVRVNPETVNGSQSKRIGKDGPQTFKYETKSLP